MNPETHAADVATPCAEYAQLLYDWTLVEALMAGTQEMAASKTWLPPFPHEESRDELQSGDKTDYQLRRDEAILFEAFADAVRGCISKFFAKPVTVENLPPELAIFEQDADGEGSTLTEFAREVAISAIAFGKTSILTSATRLPDGELATRGQVMRGEVRPYFVHTKAPDLIGWDHFGPGERRPRYGGGLLSIRIREQHHEPVGDWGTECQPQVRVIRAPEAGARSATFEIWRKGRDGWAVAESGTIDIDGIALETIYTNKLGRQLASPPMRGLAYLNLQHFRELSDHIQSGHILRMGNKYFRAGWDDDDLKAYFSINPRQIATAKDPDAKLQAIEWTGAGYERSRNGLKDIEQRMEAMSARPAMERTGGITATSTAIHHSEADSDAKAWIEVVEKGLENAFRHAAAFRRIELPQDFAVRINRDAVAALRDSNAIRALGEARKNGDLTREEYLRQLQTQGVIHEGVDVAKAAEAAGVEGPPGASIFADEDDDDGVDPVIEGGGDAAA